MTDDIRLEWLTSNNHMVAKVRDRWYAIVGPAEIRGFGSLREAIDAAIAYEKVKQE